MNLLAEKADALIEQGIRAQKVGQFTQAIAHYQKSIDLYPTAQAYSLIGIIYFEQADFYKALTHFDEATRLDPFGDLSYWGRAKCHVALGDYSWAISQFERAIRMAEPDVPAIYREDLAEAERLLEKQSHWEHGNGTENRWGIENVDNTISLVIAISQSRKNMFLS